MRSRTDLGIVVAAVAIAALLSPLGGLRVHAGPSGDFNIDSFFDISYSVGMDAEGNITVKAVGVTHDGDVEELPTDIARVIRGGEFTTIYINHPGQELITEINAFGKELQIVGLRVLGPPKKYRFRGHVTVLK